MARGRSSSHATMRSILIAAAVATCCKWSWLNPNTVCVGGQGAHSLRERPFDAGPSLRELLPSSLADQVCAAASASYCSWGGSRSRRPVCLARVQLARTGHVPHVCLSNSTMMGRLPCHPHAPTRDRQVALGAAYLLLVPVHRELLQV